ncbi:PAS domain-containing protein [Bdellovibrio bacteriovorus]|uniref:sensor histidine kinase n=1 Tax=Bdellovibrio bacteriovorus TaxID=959 RepID=UPI0021CE26E3|nr:PAS domain-containing protein [Bdellovibrio bacteriovorus]UXR63803.1 PAS domain-containing protein [Bdellovibrio bacteriovorus]
MKIADLLNDKNTLLEKINQTIPNSVYIFDLNEVNMVWFNDRVKDLYGYTLAEIRAQGTEYYARSMHPDDVPVLNAAIERSRELKEGEVISIEYRFKDSKGQYHWINDRITPFSRDEHGKVNSILGIATDVNDRKSYEETLKKTIEKMNLSLSAANMGTWEWDIEQNRLQWDSKMYSMHDVPQEPGIDPMTEVWKRALREDMENVNRKVNEAVTNHQDFYVTYRVAYQNKEVHHIKCYGKFMTPSGTPRMYGVAWDSTEEIQTEMQMAEAKAKMISSTKMAALGEMSGGIAHEINNPLTVIQARAFQLQQMVDAGKTDPVKIKQAAESISRTADKIARIIKSLRSFAREGTYDPFEVVPVKQVIEETLEFCRTRFYNHGVEIEVGPIDPDLEVECRLIQIEQVLLNLLNNSFDAIADLKDKWIRINVAEQEDSIEIFVTDSGGGIPATIADQIMLPFFTTKEVGKGTGLGLSISAGIIKSHKGDLRLHSEAPNTTFVIKLPRWQEETALDY